MNTQNAKLPTFRDADTYDDWKHKSVASLVTLLQYQPILDGHQPMRLENIEDAVATANLQRARDALIAKERQERQEQGKHGGASSVDKLPSEELPPVQTQVRPEHLHEYNQRNKAWFDTNRALWASIVRCLEGEPLTVSKRTPAGDGLALWIELEQAASGRA